MGKDHKEMQFLGAVRDYSIQRKKRFMIRFDLGRY